MSEPSDTGNEEVRAWLKVRPEWLSLTPEMPMEPALPIVDAHHHLWDRPQARFLLNEYLAEFSPGHNVIASVFVECNSMYKADAPTGWHSLGETEFASGVAAMSESGIYGPSRVCAGIVGNIDLRLGSRARDILERHIQVAGGRFRGVRNISMWDADPQTKLIPRIIPPGLLLDADFRRGFAELAALGLSFDTFLYHSQLPELVALCREFPDTAIIIDHTATPLGIGHYASQKHSVIQDWRKHLRELAELPNTFMKIGGLGMHVTGFGFARADSPPTSDALAKVIQPYVEFCVATFGPARCMFESNFPVDKTSYSYTVLWNAFKRVTKGYSESERRHLFSDTARRVYRLNLP